MVHAILAGLQHRAPLPHAAEGVRSHAVLLGSHDNEPRLDAMKSSGNSESPSRRERAPLPDCLTRLLDPQRLNAGYVAQAAGPVPAGSNERTYVGVLASIWLDLDRLGHLADLMVNPKRPA